MPSAGPILVTGAAGFLGRYVSNRLRSERLDFVATDAVQGGGAEAVAICDLASGSAVSALVSKHRPSAIIHLAAMLPTACNANPERGSDVNIGGSLNLLRAACQAGVKRFVFSSSTSVYGYGRREPPPGEDNPLTPQDLYGAAKVYIEMAGRRMQALHSLEFAALRVATLIGPGARNTGSKWRSEIFEKLGGGSPQTIAIPSAPEDRAALVHAEDAARMLVLLATRPQLQHQAYNTPVESPSFAELKSLIESADRNITVELGGSDLRPLPSPVDGTRFRAEFAFELLPVAQRLAQAVQAPK